MHKAVKQYADNGDVSKIRFTFLSSLDVDPTFEEYKEDLEYCKNIPGVFEKHTELNPFERNSAKWNDDYWASLKSDMQDNFSMERFAHMREVAKVLYADKVERLKDERREAVAAKEAAAKAAAERKAADPQPTASVPQSVRTSSPVSNEPEQDQIRERVVKRYSEPQVPVNPALQNQQRQGGGAPPKPNRIAVPIIVVGVLLAAVLLIVLLK